MPDLRAHDAAAPMIPASSRVHRRRHLAYMDPASTLTLREGLEEYYGTIDDLVTDDNAAPDVAALFRFHDTTHVLFGCDTSMRGEALTDTWSVFGTDVTLKAYRRYFELQETQDIFASMTFWEKVQALAISTVLIPRALWRALRMTKKWSFRDHEAYLDRPLCEVRAEFGIRVIES
ncbi:MAG: hypothetical protein H6719_35645 [Sandaracinaceae bacterium]|nr:hypothetical protein [Sandaracinaceae bacterium]